MAAPVPIAERLAARERKELVRLVVIGSVDDGKSTLIGRLLYETGSIYQDQLEQVRRASKNGDAIDFSLFTDGLRAEREQGITIDVAYRFFETAGRKFILADTPGHAQYTRNMATGASTADAAVILIDARLGVLPQTRRHAAIAALLGIPHLAVAVNKLDLLDFDEAVFRRIEAEVRTLVAGLGFRSLRFFPVSARLGDNVTSKSPRTPWHTGGTILGFLESVELARDLSREPLRFPVQTVLRPNLDYRGYAGQITSGTVAVGDDLVVLPSGVRTRVKAIDTFDGPLQQARAPQSIVLRLEGEVDAGRGDLLTHPEDAPQPRWAVEATAVWLSEQPLDPGRAYLVKHTTRTVPARIEAVRAVLDLETNTEHPASTLRLNELGKIALRLSRPILSDPYSRSRGTGALLVIDALTNQTVAAATVREDSAQPQTGPSTTSGLVLLVQRSDEQAALAAAVLLERSLAERGRPAALVFSAEAAVAVAAAQVVALVPTGDPLRAAALRTAALAAGSRVVDADEESGL